jgi:DNA modification methylase
LQGDCREVLAGLPEQSVHCVITSPPYWGLRDYGVDGQIGLEASLETFIEEMVGVFRKVWRVLRDDGTCWMNLGDAYAGSTHSGGSPAGRCDGGTRRLEAQREANRHIRMTTPAGLKAKDLCGVPWRVALALQADGWYLRSDIIWSKPNPMPESVTDRPTKSHEYLFLLSKQARYYYDADAVREAHTAPERQGKPNSGWDFGADRRQDTHLLQYHPLGRNRRTVWTITPQPFPGAHFATFPEALVRPCLLAGTSARGVCGRCGSPYRRVVERGEPVRIGGNAGVSVGHADGPMDRNGNGQWDEGHMPMVRPTTTTGWQPSCTCEAGEPVPATCLDPFAGAGTVSLVAAKHGRSSIAIELNPDYLDLARERLEPWLGIPEPVNGA